MKPYRWIVPVLLAAAATTGAPRYADASDGPAKPATADDKAAQFLSEGNKAFKAGKLPEAEKAYESAFAVKKAYDTAGSLAMAQFSQGKTREAAEHLAYALRLFPLTGEPAQRTAMQKAFDQCKASVGAVKVSSSVKGAQVYLGEKLVGEAPLDDDLFVEAGEHTVTVKAEGYKAASAKVNVAKGAVAEVTLKLVPEPRKDTPVIVEVPAKRRSAVPSVVLGAGALAAAGGGLAMFLLSNGSQSHALDLNTQITGSTSDAKSCRTTPANKLCGELASSAQQADTFRYISVGAFIGAGVLAAGALTYALWPTAKPQQKTGLTLHAAPTVGEGRGSMVVWGTF